MTEASGIHTAASPASQGATAGLVLAAVPGPKLGGWPSLLTAGGAASLVVVDGFMISLAAPEITADFSAPASILGLLIGAFALPLATLPLVFGVAGERLGARRMLIFGTLVVLLGAVASAISPSIEILLIARFLQGIGASMLSPQSLVIALRSLEPARLGTAIAAWTAFSSIGFLVGPVIGGVLIETLGWRSIFLVAAIGAAATAVAARFCLPAECHPGAGAAKPFPFLQAGLITVSTGLVLLMLPLAFSGDHRGMVCSSLGAVLLFCWAGNEFSRCAHFPQMFGPDVLRRLEVYPPIVVAFSINGAGAGIVGVASLILADYGSTAAMNEIARVFVPVMLVVVCVTALSGTLLRHRTSFLSGALIFAGLVAAFATLAFGDRVLNHREILAIETIILLTAVFATSAILLAFASKLVGSLTGIPIGAASGALSMGRNLGSAFGSAAMFVAYGAYGPSLIPFTVSAGFFVLASTGIAAQLALEFSPRRLKQI